MLSGSAASTVITLERSAPTPSRSILSRVRPQPRRNEGRGIEPAFQFRSVLGDGSWKNQGGMEGLFEA
jgi:hypothetical protein